MKKLFITIIILLTVGCESVAVAPIVKQINKIPVKEVLAEEKTDLLLPLEMALEVQFMPQAPLANWDVHDDSCEEAGILLAHYYYINTKLSNDSADAELKKMIAFQRQNLGEHRDIFGEEIKWLADEFYGYEARVIEGTQENIKNELVGGNPVIALTTAAYLKPEKSTYPEMGYHIIVIIGYDETGFITHDVGTRSGENVHYSYGIIEKAIADYNREMVVLK